jgi:hypothetical protein
VLGTCASWLVPSTMSPHSGASKRVWSAIHRCHILSPKGMSHLLLPARAFLSFQGSGQGLEGDRGQGTMSQVLLYSQTCFQPQINTQRL